MIATRPWLGVQRGGKMMPAGEVREEHSCGAKLYLIAQTSDHNSFALRLRMGEAGAWAIGRSLQHFAWAGSRLVRPRSAISSAAVAASRLRQSPSACSSRYADSAHLCIARAGGDRGNRQYQHGMHPARARSTTCRS
jgi:hypothetical protein